MLYIIIIIIIIIFFLVCLCTIKEKFSLDYLSKSKNLLRHKKGEDGFKNLCDLNDWYFEIVEDFLTEEECDKIINLTKDKLTDSYVNSTGKEKSVLNKDIRTSKLYWAGRNEDPLFEKISKKVSDKLDIPQENQEKIQIIHYKPNGFYKKHYDSCDIKNDNCIEQHERIGKRTITAFIYLNDIEKGGETSFNNIGVKVKPKKGMAVFWNNLDINKNRNYCSLHEAQPPISGDKWALTVWSRTKKQ